jgi:predicted ArsR family transcriptional regulator
MLESIADPLRLRVVRHLDESGPASLTELARVVNAHVNTVRPHVQALEEDGILVSRQREARGPGRRVIEYSLREPLSVPDSDLMAMAELLAAALARAQLDSKQLRRIGADWGRYLSGRPSDHEPSQHLPAVLTRFGYSASVDSGHVRLERCLCPLVSPDAPLNICVLVEGRVDGALAAAGSDLHVVSGEHRPEERSCRLDLAESAELGAPARP